MKPRRRRLIYVALGLALLGITAALVLNAFRSNLVFFYSPTQVADKEAPLNKTFRLGGLVEQGSLKRLPDGITVSFVVTDTGKSIPVRYRGILPDLFKEGKGVVAQGRLEPDGTFQAQQVLAKHDENYMPPEAAEAIAKAQHGQLPEPKK
ncbi:MAG: cytochrome c maturation protein CcmE [Burkholderiales bacterium]